MSDRSLYTTRRDTPSSLMLGVTFPHRFFCARYAYILLHFGSFLLLLRHYVPARTNNSSAFFAQIAVSFFATPRQLRNLKYPPVFSATLPLIAFWISARFTSPTIFISALWRATFPT